MPGVKRARQDGREDPIALDDEIYAMMHPDGTDDPDGVRRPARGRPGGHDSAIGYDPDDEDEYIDDLDDGPRRRLIGDLSVSDLLMLGAVGAVTGLIVIGGGLWLFWPSDKTAAPETSPPAVAALDPAPAAAPEAPATAPDPAPPEPREAPDSTAATPPAAIPAPPPPPDVPVVRADEAPFRTEPEDPGGLQVENTDKLIYDRLDDAADGGDQPAVEQLLPAPTRPVPPPAPEATPAPTPAPESAAASPPPTATEPPAPPPVPETAATPESAPEPTAPTDTADPAAPAPGPAPVENVATTAQQGPQVQLAAFRDRPQAEAYWRTLSEAHPDLLGNTPHVIVFADLGDRGQFYRLRAGPFGTDDAAAGLCQSLKQRDVECMIVRE